MRLKRIPQDEALVKSAANKKKLVDFAIDCMQFFYRYSELRDRYVAVDEVYMGEIFKLDDDCKRIENNDSDIDNLVVPVLLSQLTAIEGYLSSIFLPEYPLFPVVGDGSVDPSMIGNIEALIEEHAVQGKWRQQFRRVFTDFARYNIGGIELSWEPIYDAQAVATSRVTGNFNEASPLTYINSLKTPNIYNLIYDFRVEPEVMSTQGEFAGYQEMITYPELITRLTRRSLENTLYYTDKDLFDSHGKYNHHLYWERPEVHRKLSTLQATNWANLAGLGFAPLAKNNNRVYSWTRMYLRIDPDDFGLEEETDFNVQIYLLEIVNHKFLVHIEPVMTYFASFPIYLASYYQDSMGIQTKSPAENIIPIQKAATDLLTDRRAATKRATADRLVYNPSLIDPAHMGSRNPTSRIPIRQSAAALADLDLSKALWPVPWTDSTENTIMGDMGFLLQLPEFASGINSSKEGRFRKGNRTLGEYEDIMGNLEDRQMAAHLNIDSQLMSPIKHQIKFNLTSRGVFEQADFISSGLGKRVELSPGDIAENINKIKLADGLTPRSKIANTQVVAAAFDAMSKLPQLAEQTDLYGVFMHLMSLSGVHNLEQFRLGQPNQPANQGAGVVPIQRGSGAVQATPSAPPTQEVSGV